MRTVYSVFVLTVPFGFSVVLLTPSEGWRVRVQAIRALQDVITMPLLDVYEHTFDEDVPHSEQPPVSDGDSEEQILPDDGLSADSNTEEGRSSP